MLLVFFLLSWTLLATADVPACPRGGIQVSDPPQNTNLTTWYPQKFTNTPPIFPKNYTCHYQINVPRGWFAEIQLTVVGSPLVQVIDQKNRAEEISNCFQEYFYFIAHGGAINLAAQSLQPNFGFSVIWKPYPTKQPFKLSVSQSYPQPSLFEMHGNQPITITADTKVSATIIPPVPQYKLQYLRGIIYLDGSDLNSTKTLGTGLQLLNNYPQYVSSGNTMSVLILSNS